MPMKLAAIAIVSLLGSAIGQVVQLQPIADATVDESQPSVNFGSDQQLNFGKNFTYTPTFTVWFMRGHLQFDFTPLAGAPTPVRARLFWYQSQASAAGCLSVELFRVTTPWNENTVTWNNKPGHAATASSSMCVGDSFSPGWKPFDVTTLVQGWLDGSLPNLGMVIRDPTESVAGAARPGFGHSRESAATNLRPYLEIDFGNHFGSGCALTGGPLDHGFAGGAPTVGGSFVLSTTGFQPNSLVLTILGLNTVFWGTTPLPAPLTSIGFSGCSLYVAPDVVLTAGPLTGTFTLTWPVPNNTALAGLTVFTQAAALVPGASFQMSGRFGVTIY